MLEEIMKEFLEEQRKTNKLLKEQNEILILCGLASAAIDIVSSEKQTKAIVHLQNLSKRKINESKMLHAELRQEDKERRDRGILG